MQQFSSLARWLPLAAAALASQPAQAQLQLTGRSPARNAVAAPRTADVSLSFNQAVSAASAGNVRVFSQQRGGQLQRTGSATLSGGGTSTLTLDPTTDFKPGETVYVTVPASVQSTTGQAAAKQVHQFTAAVGGTGTGSFGGGSDPVVSSPSCVATGDMDGDGDLDLITATGGGTVSVRLNNGAGSFGGGSDVTVGGSLNWVATGDMDGDGDLDLVTATAGGAVGVRLNNGAGSFGSDFGFNISGNLYCVTVGDVDADGDLDLLTAYTSTGSSNGFVHVRLNGGAGSFGFTGFNVAVGTQPRVVTVGDVDGDGDLDLLTANDSGTSVRTVSVRLNDGTGSFSGTSEVTVGFNPRSVAVGDVDADGDLDLIMAGSLIGGGVSVRLNDGAGNFSGGSDLAISGNLNCVATGDVDADGDLDLLAVNSANFGSPGTVSVRLNNGTGSFSGGSDVAVGAFAYSAVFGDVDADGDLDMLVANRDANTVSVRLNRTAAPTLTSFSPTSGPVGTSVTLTGTGFASDAAVTFNGTAASSVVVNSATSLTATVPTGATTGLIRVTTSGGTATSASNFTVTIPAPAISSFTPASGPVNRLVVLQGSNFTGATAVTFNGTSASFTVYSPTQITTFVPFGATTGTIRVTTPGGTATSAGSFTVQPDPVVSSFSPGSGPVGSQVIINGANFTGAQSVAFGVSLSGPSTPVLTSNFTVDSPTRITVIVPPGATSGSIGVNTGGNTGFSTTSFIVTAAAPSISSFTPASGPTGTSVTITGTNFSGATAVRFNGTSASSYTVNSATQITTSVPAGATSGPISVTTAGGTATSATSFTVPLPNAAPTALTLSNASVAENQPYNTLVGSFFTTDPNPSDTTHTYTLVAGAGSSGNASFVISGRQLRTNNVFDFETQTSYAVRVRTTDQGGLWFERTFTISVTNLADLPTISSFTPTSGPAGTSVTVMGTNLFDLTGVSINNVAVTSPIIGDPVAGDRATFNVPAGATTGLIRISTTAGTATSSTNFTVPAPQPSDLVVSSAQSISGSYNNVTITGTGAATLSGPLTVSGTLTVQTGGTLTTACQPLTGSGSFVLQAGGTLGICDAQGITASGSTGAIQLTGSRSFSAAASYVYNGSQAQVTGAGLPATVRNLTLGNATGLTLSQPLALSGVLTLSAGVLSTNGQALTLLSDAAGTALVVNINGVVNGTVTVQRYISPAQNAGPGYRHLAAPVSGSTVADLATAGFGPVVNPAYNSAVNPGSVTPFPTVFGYDQARQTSSPATGYSTFDKGWFSPANTTDALQVGRGYTVNIPGGLTPDFVGTLNNGTLALSLGRGTGTEAGWQLIGNPYPAPLDWSRVTPTDRPGLDAAMHVYESTGPYVGRYRSYVNGIGNPVLPLGQAFFVRVADSASAATLTLRNAQRLTTPDATPLLRTTADTRPQLQLQLHGAGTNDAAYVYFEQGATAGVDAAYDARKLANPTGLNLAALAGSSPLAVTGLPPLTAADRVVALHVQGPQAGTYTLRAAELLHLPVGTSAYLRDAETGALVDLRQQSSYAFTLASAVPVTGRFTLLFTQQRVLATAPAGLSQQVALYPNPARSSVSLALPASLDRQPVSVAVLNALGQQVLSLALPASRSAAQVATLPLTGLARGVYTLRLTTPQGLVAKRLVVE